MIRPYDSTLEPRPVAHRLKRWHRITLRAPEPREFVSYYVCRVVCCFACSNARPGDAFVSPKTSTLHKLLAEPFERPFQRSSHVYRFL
jgi:hypothetical protein